MNSSISTSKGPEIIFKFERVVFKDNQDTFGKETPISHQDALCLIISKYIFWIIFWISIFALFVLLLIFILSLPRFIAKLIV